MIGTRCGGNPTVVLSGSDVAGTQHLVCQLRQDSCPLTPFGRMSSSGYLEHIRPDRYKWIDTSNKVDVISSM